MELYTGLTQKIYTDVYSDGELAVADDLPTVTVFDLETNDEIVSGTAIESGEDNGFYAFSILDDYLNVDRQIKVVWEYEINENPLTTVEFYDVVTPYVSLSEIYKKLGFGREIGDENYKSIAEVSLAEQYARFMVESYTGQKFGKYEGHIACYGQDADVLYLGERIITFKKLSENNRLVIDLDQNFNNFGFDVEITESHYSLRIFSTGDINEGGKLDMVYRPKGYFNEGWKYDVEGIFGWKRVPEKIQMAALMLMQDFFSKDNAWRAKYVTDVTYGDSDMKFSKLAFKGTGNFFVDKLLDEFKSPGIAVI
jgi:hypothetical protein